MSVDEAETVEAREHTCDQREDDQEDEQADRAPLRLPLLDKKVPFGEPEVEEEQRCCHEKQCEDAEHVVANPGRRLVNAGVATRGVMRAARRCDDAEQDEESEP